MPEKEAGSVLIVGGGIAGLTAAKELAMLGVNAFVIEKGPFIGGHAVNLTCKATDRCMKCNDCLVEECMKSVACDTSFHKKVATRITDIERIGDQYKVTLISGPQFIDPQKCNNCGACYQKCPGVSKGAIRKASSHHLHPSYTIDPAKCDACGSPEEGICREVCPENAIDLSREEESWSLEVEGMVLATGYEPFDPKETERYNFHAIKNMITCMDLEKILRSEGRVIKVSDGASPRKVAFLQCVGSRDARLGHEFCSRVCCGYALRMGIRLLHDNPGMEITVFYMDIQNFGKDFDQYYREAHSVMRIIRGLPGDFYSSGEDNIVVSYYDEKSTKTISEAFDMVFLSVGLMPAGSNKFFVEKLDLNINEDGFLDMKEEKGDCRIVIAGTAEGPMDVSESISHAKRAAFDLAGLLGIV